MRDAIIKLCKQIEQEENIKILFAIESGSRLWRMSSEDSDYDIRFVFIQPLDNYITIKNQDATEKVINKMYQNGLIDFSGFDIFKYCKLLAKSNPSIIEWLQADIMYYGEKPKEIQNIAFSQFNPIALFHHYKSMCKQNYEKYLVSQKLVTYKKYLYAMRGLCNAKYVQATGKLPPIQFTECLERCKGIVPDHILDDLKEIIAKKKSGKEKEIIQNIVQYDKYIESFLKEEVQEIKGRKPNPQDIDKALKSLVLKA